MTKSQKTWFCVWEAHDYTENPNQIGWADADYEPFTSEAEAIAKAGAWVANLVDYSEPTDYEVVFVCTQWVDTEDADWVLWDHLPAQASWQYFYRRDLSLGLSGTKG